MGRPKATLPFGPRVSFLEHLAALYRRAGILPLAVLGSRGREIAQRYRSIGFVFNRRWRHGQFSSVRTGLRAALRQGADWIFVHPVDMPLVRARTLRKLSRHLLAVDQAVIPTYRGKPGHPVLLSAWSSRKILRMRVTHLAAALSHLQTRRVAVNDPGSQVNINLPADYTRFIRTRRKPS